MLFIDNGMDNRNDFTEEEALLMNVLEPGAKPPDTWKQGTSQVFT